MRVVLVMILAMTTVSAQAPARVADIYRGVVAVYVAGGELKQAVIPLQSWTRKEFDTAIDAIIARRDIREMEAAAVLQLEFGVAVVHASVVSAEQHFNLGKRLVNTLHSRYLSPRLPKNMPLPRDFADFYSDWFAVAGSAFLSINHTVRAYQWIAEATKVAPDSAALTTLWGVRAEIAIAARDPHVSFPRPSSAQARRELLEIVDVYRKAIGYDATYAPAYLRLGRLLSVVGNLPEARATLERALAVAREPAHRDLAALMLGGVLQQQRDLAGARRSYERALEAVPVSQAVTAALGYLDVIEGRPDRAQARVEAFVAAPADDPHWWGFKYGGIYHEGLDRLRKRVRQ